MKRLLLAGAVAALVVGSAAAQNINQVTAPHAGGLTWTLVTCGATSTALGVAGGQYLTVQVPPTATQPVWFSWGGTAASVSAATTAAPSQGYAAGTNISWGGGTGACIVATGTQVISVGTK